MPSYGQGRLAYEAQPFRIYPDELLYEAQDALANLADIDLRYEKALNHADEAARRAGDRLLLNQLHDRLVQRHHRERHRVEEKLGVIHKRISELMMRDLRTNQG
jgi:hypothetical protein